MISDDYVQTDTKKNQNHSSQECLPRNWGNDLVTNVLYSLDLSSDSEHPHKKLNMVANPCNPSAEEME